MRSVGATLKVSVETTLRPTLNFPRENFRSDFLLGNIPGFPQEDWYRHFSKYQKEFGAWGYQYDLTVSLYITGDVVFLNLNAAGVTMLVVGSLEIAEELAGKRTKVYSSRPYTVMLSEL